MKRAIIVAVFVVPVLTAVAPSASPIAAAGPASAPTIEQFLAPGYPTEIVSARKAERVAWTAYEHGQRNVFSAAAPDFKPLQLTRFLKDDGVELSDLAMSDDGTIVTFVRGTAPNREGWVANPTSAATGADRTVWAARTSGAAAWKIGEVTTPALSPDGRIVLFAKEGQLYRYDVRLDAGGAPGAGRGRLTAAGTSLTPFVKAWGTNRNPVWSPDGSKIAFISDRTDHSFIGVYDLHTRQIRFLSPSVDRDTSPTWSPDSRRIAFIRRPGLP